MKKNLLFFFGLFFNQFYYLLDTQTNKLIYKPYNRNKFKKLIVHTLLFNQLFLKNIYENNNSFSIIDEKIHYKIENNNNTINYYFSIENNFYSNIKIFNNENNNYNYINLNYLKNSSIFLYYDYNYNISININNKFFWNNNKIFIPSIDCNNGFIIFNKYKVCKNNQINKIIITSDIKEFNIIDKNKNLLINNNKIINVQLYENLYEFTGYININQDIIFKLIDYDTIIPIKIFLYYYNYRYNFFYCLTDNSFKALNNCKLFYINTINFNQKLFQCLKGDPLFIQLKFLNYYKTIDLCQTIMNKIITYENNIDNIKNIENIISTISDDCNKNFIFNLIIGCSFFFFWVFQFFFHLYKNFLLFARQKDPYIFHYFIFKNIFFSVLAIFISQTIVLSSYILLAKSEYNNNYNLFIDDNFFIFLIILQFLNTGLHFFSWIKYILDFYQKDFFFIDLNIIEDVLEKDTNITTSNINITTSNIINKPFIIQLNSLSKVKSLIYMYLQNDSDRKKETLNKLSNHLNKYFDDTQKMTINHNNNFKTMLIFLLNIEYIQKFSINNSFYKYIITQDQLFILKNYILNKNDNSHSSIINKNLNIIKNILINNESFIGSSWLNELIIFFLNIFILVVLLK